MPNADGYDVVLSEELEGIRAEHPQGLLVPADVVAFAKANPGSEVYKRFRTWDRDKAAEEFWLEEARRIIRLHVRVTPENLQPTRVYVSLRDDRVTAGGGYRPMEQVMSEAELRRRFLAQALDDVNYWMSKYRRLQELAGIFEAIQKAQEAEAGKPKTRRKKAPRKREMAGVS